MELQNICDPLLDDSDDVKTNASESDWCERICQFLIFFLSVFGTLGVVIGFVYGIVIAVKDSNKYGKYSIDRRHLVKCIVEGSNSTNLLEIVQQCLVNLTLNN
jgi:hypothetical protein